MLKKIALVLLFLTLLVGAFIGWRAWSGYQSLSVAVQITNPIMYEVKPGDHLRKIAVDLKRRRLISDALALYLYGRYTGQGRQIKVGEFELQGSMNALQILQRLTSNDVKQYQVTFVEGITFKEMLAQMQQAARIQVTLSSNPKEAEQQLKEAIAESFGVQLTHLEGYLFPSTYQFPANTTDLTLFKQAFQKMQQTLEAEWANKADDLPYKTPYEALIMASIIEKETGVPEERDEIAGVFVRRLQKRMRLQTDPTIIYGLGDQYKGNLTRAHLRDGNNPYNTYKIKALPPTPIGMPGAEAIHAALHPADGTALYFVAKGDGTHYFSSTLKEHNSAVRRYQLNRRKDYRSSQ